MQTIEITSAAQFDALSPKWDELCARTGQNTPFHTPDWFRCCLSSYAAGNDLFTLAFEHNGLLAGVAALWRSWEALRGIRLRVEKLSFVSCPDSPFVDFIVLEDLRKETLVSMLRHLRNQVSWDVLTLEGWPVSSPNCQMFRDLVSREGMQVNVSRSSSTPYLSMNGDWDTFLKTRSVKFRKTHRNIINRMSKLGNTEIQRAQQDLSGSALLDAMKVSEKGWKHKEGIAITSRQESKKFFAELTPVAAARGWLDLWLLTSNQAPLAMEYDLTSDGVTYALRSDFDENFGEFSPGTYLEYHIMKHHFDAHSREYSAGPGLNQYKLHWTDSVRDNLRLQIYNHTYKGQLAWWLECRVIPAMRLMKRKVFRSQ